MAQSFREIVGAGPSTASPSNSTLVIIDAQNEYAEGKLKVSNAPETRKAIAALLKKYREAGGKVVHVKHTVPEGAPVFTPNTKLAEEYDELKPEDGEKVINKIHPSSFADTNLHDYLRGVGGLKVVLVGYMVGCLPPKHRAAADVLGPCLRIDNGPRCCPTRLRRPDRRRLRGRQRHTGCLWRGRDKNGDA